MNDTPRPSRRMVITDDDLGAYAERGGRYDDDLSLGERSRNGVRWSGYVRVAPQFGDRVERAIAAAPGPAPAVVHGGEGDAPLTSRLTRALAGPRCVHCNELFTPRRSTARFCSASCRSAARHAR